ncbi:MAG: hypothetical protein IKY98_00590 [Alphaproteobacteria bacterium]|nr:hypothetical protein [Alphaproteobacteria bacterium]
MKKILLCLTILVNASYVNAQENIPVFDDPMPTMPNIGRMAEPLDKLVLTPNPLPEVEINLSKQRKQQNIEVEVQKKPAVVEVPESKEFARSEPLSIRKPTEVKEIKRVSSDVVKEADSLKDAQAQVDAYAQEMEQAETEVQTSAEVTTQSASVSVSGNIGGTLMQSPEVLEGLFGKTHDVRGFEVAGIALGMTPDEVMEITKMMGYKRTDIRYGIPMYRSAFYEQNCRDRRIHVLNDVRECIEKQADRDRVKYVSSMTFAKPKTKEYLRVLFTTYATDNQAFKIYYESEGDNSLTMTQRNLAKQLRRKDMFWRMMFENYGLPDDSELILWGNPDKAYMQAVMTGSAYNAYIVLEDKEIQDEDYFVAEDEREFLNYRNPFTFAPDVTGE